MALFFYSVVIVILAFLQSLDLFPAKAELVLSVLLLAFVFFSGAEVIFLYILAGGLLYLVEPRFWAIEVFSYGAAIMLTAAVYNLLDFSYKILIAAPLGLILYYFATSFYYHFFSVGNFIWFFVKNTAVFLAMFYLLGLSFKKNNLRQQVNWT